MEKPAIEGGKPVRETPIYYGHQYIDDADIQAVVEVMKRSDGFFSECRLPGQALLCQADRKSLS